MSPAPGAAATRSDGPAPIIEAHGLTKRFGEFTAVDAVDLEIPPGTLYAFLGANGSGKSTTIRMLIGLLTPSAGTVAVDGVDVIAHPRAVRDRIGYMGQKVSLYQGLTLRENVEFYAGLYGIAGRDLEARWAEVRERFALAEAEGERPENLPAGLRQRAGLALSTLHAPRLLFLDEPTAGVDVESRALFWERIRDESEAGVTVFVTTHFLEEVDYCDRVSFIDAGRLVADDTPEGMRARYGAGYRIAVPARALRGGDAEHRLREAGFRWAGAAPGADAELVHLEVPALGPSALAALARALGPEAAGRVHITPPSMNDVFAEVIRRGERERAAGARGPGDAAGGGTAPS